MNIKNILTYGGYEIIEETIENKSFRHLDWTCIYKIKFNDKFKAKTLKEIQEKITVFEGDINAIWTVIVTNIGFNGHGNLWLELAPIDDDTKCFDLIEYD